MTTDSPARFLAKFESLAGKTCRAVNSDYAIAYVLAVIDKNEARCVAFGRMPAQFRERLRSACAARGVTVLSPPYQRKDLPAAIDGAQIGIALASHAIEETGTLIEITTDDGERLVSCLPRTFIGLIDPKTILSRYYDAALILREAFAQRPESCVVSFMSGPSRTGDIEMKLTLGVHGPGDVHAVVLDYTD